MPRRLARTLHSTPAAFLVGGLALTLLIWVIGGGFAWHSRGTELERARAMSRGVAETLAFNAAATLQNIDGALTSLTAEFGANWARYEFERFRATGILRAGMAGAPAVHESVVVDAMGRVLHRNVSPEPDSRAFADWPTFQWHRENRSLSLRLSLHEGGGPATRTPELVASRRLSAPDGRFLGVVLMVLDRGYLEAELHAGRLWRGALVGLYDDAGRVLVGTAPAAELPPLPDVMSARLIGLTGGGQAYGVVGIPRSAADNAGGPDALAAFAPVGSLPLAVGLEVPEAEALERWRDDTIRFSILLVVLTLVLVITALALRGALREISANQRKVEENERRFRSIFNNAGAGIALVGPDGVVAEINEQFARMLQRERREVVGRRLLDLTVPEDVEVSRVNSEGVRTGALPTAQYEKRYCLPDGSAVWVEVTLSPQIDVANRDLSPDGPRGSVVVARDITQRRAAREVIQEKTRALERSNIELEEFAYVASHDLQEPLRTVASYLQLLQRRYGAKLDDDARDYIGFAVAGAHRMSLLIQDLLQYSRVGRMGRPMRPVDLTAAVRQAREALSQAVAESGATLTVPPDLPTVLADEAEITRLFQNLLGNAIKYRRPDRAPDVRVTVEDDGDAWTIAVHDNGIGIATQYYEKVFKIFQRLHGRDEYAGTGVGLSICKKIAERHGGRIWVESEPGAGSVFRVSLPKLETALAAAATAAAEAAETPPLERESA
ncbi:ATP-binding protein [Caenispirillum bisanense]|uniref:histidine kinase n=1 Tax=Caenispirillum bisanense TaxID=414052 RepID=A0A286G8I9_9PROT|nr:ATP-binding protein [Caenispirillum bisanense]SOD91831.1 PAS domain S-box-containing protein [Caenispirillum bisanense]